MFLPQYSWWLVAFYLVIPIHSAPVAHPAHTGNAADLAGGDMDPELSPDQFEGDMLGFIVLPGANRFDTAVDDENKRWKNGVVPYVISDEYSVPEIEELLTAFSFFEKNTCVRFVPRCDVPDEAMLWPGCNGTDFIFIKPGGGCSSYIGRRGGQQPVNLGKRKRGSYGCFTPNQNGRVQHELLHCLGFIHEHTRTDRDKYVTINMDHIIPGLESNFQLYQQENTTSFGEPYDYDSVMHYPQNAFTLDGHPTIIAKGDHAIGQRRGLSPADIRKINMAYEKECAARETSNSSDNDP